jgi:pyrroline-5-carboxylate reductase
VSLWLIGCGNMGGALLRRWLETGLDAADVTVVDPTPQQIAGVRWVPTLPSEEAAPDILVLGIKPQLLAAVSPQLSGHADKATIVLSMLAGVECATLQKLFPEAHAIVRAMPNLPVSIGKGVTGLFSTKDECRTAIDALMAGTGLTEWLDDEGQFHALTALSGSGPAFVYRFIAALSDAGTALGLPAEQALRLARAMTEGASAVAASSDTDPQELARRVTSAGGVTAEGLRVLDQDSALSGLIRETLTQAALRSAEMAEEAAQTEVDRS